MRRASFRCVYEPLGLYVTTFADTMFRERKGYAGGSSIVERTHGRIDFPLCISITIGNPIERFPEEG